MFSYALSIDLMLFGYFSSAIENPISKGAKNWEVALEESK